ncbi:MAG: L,D-transpeptidase family protein [Rhodothermales bacterium]
MLWTTLHLLLLVTTAFVGLFSEDDDFADARRLYYTVSRDGMLYRSPSDAQAYLALRFREPLIVIERNPAWSRVRTRSGEQGYVQTGAISNVWIRVSKRRKAVYVYRGTELVRKIPADFGANVVSDKIRRGNLSSPDDWRTPEGTFFVVSKNPNSKFYKAFVLNYPNAEDADRGFQDGIISREQRDAIVAAEERGDMPPMDTQLGGWIEIHGSGTGGGTNWTQGCVAIRNEQMDELWALVNVGTPVITEY